MKSIVLVAVVGVTLAACSGGGDATQPTTLETTPATAVATTTSATVAPAGGTEWSVSGALAQIPADGATTFELTTGDLAAISELFGVTPPDDLSDVDAAINGWLLPLTFPGTPEYRPLPVWVALQEPLVPRNPTDFAELDALLGWSLAEADAFVDYRPPAPGYLVVAHGEFADDALAGLDEIAPGVATSGPGDDLAVDVTAIGPLDSLGRSVRLARRDDSIAMSLTTALAERWLAGDTTTLADDQRAAAVAEALDAAGVLTAHVFRNDFWVGSALGATPMSPEVAEQITAAVADVPPFDTVGIGWAIDDSGRPSAVLAYAPLDGDAAALAAQLEGVFADGESLIRGFPVAEVLGAFDPEIVAADGVVTVTYRPVDAFWWTAIQAVYQRDLPFVHG